MVSIRHFYIAIVLCLMIFSIGTFGYMAIEEWDLLDAVYMTAITITTVGFSEVHAMSRDGRIFTIGLVVTGVAMFLYVAGSLAQFMIEGKLRDLLGRRSLNKQIAHLNHHYIVCGYGRIGRVLCQHFKAHRSVFQVIVEQDPERIPELEADGLLYIIGDATEEQVLLAAGIKKAKGLVAALARDVDNVYLVLTARQLNPDIFIVARATERRAKSKLLAAGANRVESPYEVGAVNMAQRVLRPSVSSFIDLIFAYDRKDIKMEEIPVHPKSSLANVMLKDSGIRQRFNLIIIAIKQARGDMLFNPSFETVIHGGDTVIAMGKSEDLLKLENILMPLLPKAVGA